MIFSPLPLPLKEINNYYGMHSLTVSRLTDLHELPPCNSLTPQPWSYSYFIDSNPLLT